MTLVPPSYTAVRLFLDGMLSMMALFALLSYFQHRKPLYWQYSLYIACMILDLRLSDIGYARPDYQPGAYFPETLVESLAYMLYIRFAILLLDPIRQDPASYRLMRLLLLGFVAVLFIDTILWLADVSAILRSSVYMTTRLLICVVVLYLVPRLFRLRSPVLSYFVAGTLLLLIGSISALLLNYLPPGSLLTAPNAFTLPITILQISIVGEVLFFAMGMSLRNRQNERQKILYQAQLIEQLRENERKQDKLQRIREDIAHDLHDDVGSDLSSIGVLSQVAASQVDQNPEAARVTIQRIGQTARRVITTMREIIWSMNSAQTSLASFSQRLQEMAALLFEYQTATLIVNLPDEDLTRLLPVESRRDLFLMVKEMLYNAIRHANAQCVYLTMWVADDSLHLTVRDDGRGFSVQAQEPQAGNGMQSMRKRTDALNGCLTIDSQPGTGTTLTFQCPLATEELVVG